MKGFFMGSWDPYHNGHRAVTKTARELFTELVIGIKQSVTKPQRYFPMDLMKIAIENVIRAEGWSNVKVICFTRPTVEVARECGATFLVKSLRDENDFRYEETKSIRHLREGMDTIYLRTNECVESISSTKIRQMLLGGYDVSQYVSKEVLDIILS